jgi:hypothetical protein
MKQKNFFLATVIALITLLTMVGCAQSAPVYAQGTEKDNAVAAAAPLTQDMLDGIQKNDFALFSKDFDASMVKAMTQDGFNSIVKQFAPYGDFKSSEIVNVQIVSTYYRVNYKLTYTNKVFTMGVVIPINGTPAVSGLWFN